MLHQTQKCECGQANRDGTIVKLDVNSGVHAMDKWVCFDETGPVFSWRGQWTASVPSEKTCQTSDIVQKHRRDVLKTQATEDIDSRNVTSENQDAHELNGLTEGEHTTMDDDPEDGEVDCEVEPADWEVRVRPRNNPAVKEKVEHEGRTHHHTTKYQSEDHLRSPIIQVQRQPAGQFQVCQ